MMRILTIICMICCWSICIGQQRFFVDQTAIGQNNGTTWGNAFINLHDALDVAMSGDEIWVAEGIYRPSLSERSIYFNQKSGVKLYGSFAGNETTLQDRNISIHPTILEGDISVLGDSLDNSYTIMYLEYPDSTTIFDGFTVQNGNANNLNASPISPELGGGGMFIMGYDSTAFPKIRNSVFKNNTSAYNGGGVMVMGLGMADVSPQFINCEFEGNYATRRGGGVFWSAGSLYDPGVDFYSCQFIRNEGEMGGSALFLNINLGADSFCVKNCIFEENICHRGCFQFSAPKDENKVIIVEKTDFLNNVFVGPGGKAINSDINNLSNFEHIPSKIYLNDIRFENENRGGIGISEVPFIGKNELAANLNKIQLDEEIEILFEAFDFERNDKLRVEINKLFGGHVGIYNCIQSEIRNSVSSFLQVGDNTVTIYENSICNPKFFFGSGDGPIGLGKGYISNSIILNSNMSLEDFPSVQNDEETVVYNSILLNNNVYVESLNTTIPSDMYIFFKDSVKYSNCYFSDTSTVSNVPHEAIFQSGNLFSIDPLFIHPDTNNYRLHPCSPLINAGINNPVVHQGLATDLEGNPRILEGIVDIGPYESAYELSQNGPPQITTACHGLSEGKIIIAAEGGCPPYSLDWTKIDDGTTGTNNEDLFAGDYSLTLSDARGRTTEINATIDGSSPNITIEGDSTACAFAPNAYLVVNITNGASPIQYFWNTGEMTSEIENLSEGQYEVAIEDAFGCVDTASVEVTATPPVDASIVVQHASDPSASDGALFFSVNSGFPPYTYQWSNGAITDSIVDLSVGNYTITVVDSNGCGYVYTYTVSFMVDIEMPQKDEMNAVFPNPIAQNTPINIRYSNADAWYLMDASGRVVARTHFASSTLNPIGNTVSMELPCLGSGVYFWSFVREGKAVKSGRLVVE